MTYLAVLGREAELSLVELESVGAEPVAFGDVALLGKKPELAHLGGAIKLAKVIDRRPWTGWDSLNVSDLDLPRRSGKTVVGVSCYASPKIAAEAKPWAFRLKKSLKGGGSVRVVVDREPLTAAQLKFNQVLAKGFELILAINGNELVLALTDEAQDIDAYSRRDYDRPKRSAKVGMLPPKLAQIMINLSGGEKIYDPFCGTGVVLQEALLMGKPAAGSDLESKMVEYTEANLHWLSHEVDRKLPDWSAETSDATMAKLPAGFSVVSEGYLGPPLSKSPTHQELEILTTELNDLYVRALTNWAKQLPAKSRHCLAVPCWRVGRNFATLPLIDQVGEIGYNLVRFKCADSRSLIYARKDQLVGRQLLVIEKA